MLAELTVSGLGVRVCGVSGLGFRGKGIWRLVPLGSFGILKVCGSSPGGKH